MRLGPSNCLCAQMNTRFRSAELASDPPFEDPDSDSGARSQLYRSWAQTNKQVAPSSGQLGRPLAQKGALFSPPTSLASRRPSREWGQMDQIKCVVWSAGARSSSWRSLIVGQSFDFGGARRVIELMIDSACASRPSQGQSAGRRLGGLFLLRNQLLGHDQRPAPSLDRHQAGNGNGDAYSPRYVLAAPH